MIRKLKQHLLFVAFAAALTVAAAALADTANDAPTTPATTFHGLPANNPGHDGTSGKPNGGDPGLSNGIHEVTRAGGTATKGDGVPAACDFHGGLGAANRNCP